MIVLALLLMPLTSAGQAPVAPFKTELAPGIVLFSRPGYGDVGLDGNSIVVTGDRKPLNDAFKSQLVDWYLHRVYEELDGPLSDAISKVPAS